MSFLFTCIQVFSEKAVVLRGLQFPLLLNNAEDRKSLKNGYNVLFNFRLQFSLGRWRQVGSNKAKFR